ncbi:MAG: hypothetical protein V3T33_06140 [Myxococcota bacterium]
MILGANARWSLPRRIRKTPLSAFAVTLVLIGGAGTLMASTGAAAGEEGASRTGEVELERLLRLPDSFDAGGERRAGSTAAEWRSRFRKARNDLDVARQGLQGAQAELESLAGDTGSYQMAAPGATEIQNSPISFRLRQDIRRQREELERGEKRLRALTVEANLADVPEAWRK